MELLNKEGLLADVPLLIEEIEVPEWKCIVRLREMTGAEFDKFNEALVQNAGDQNCWARIIALSMVNGDGHRICSDDELVDGAKALLQRPYRGFARLVRAVGKLNGIIDSEQGQMAKN